MTKNVTVQTEAGRTYRQSFNTIACFDNQDKHIFTVRLPTEDEVNQLLEDMTGECIITVT